MLIPSKYKLVKTLGEVKELISYCKQTGYCSYDFETKAKGPMGDDKNKEDKPTGFAYKEDEPTVLGISFQIGSTWVIPLFHFDSPFSRNEVLRILRLVSKEVFENPNIVKIGQNIKFEHKWLMRYDCNMRGRQFDLMLAKYLCDEERPHDLKSMVQMFLGEELHHYEDEVRELVNRYRGWEYVPLEPLAKYNGIDCDVTFRIYMKLERRLINLGIYSLYRNLLMMASRVLAESEFNGIKVDREYLNKIIAEQGKYIEKNLKNLKGHPKIKKFEEWRLQNHIEKLILKAEEEIEELENIGKKHLISTRMEKISRYIAGNLITKKEKGNIDEGVNFNSPNQMVDLLFESPRGFRFKFLKITGSGNPSTDEETLLKLKSKDKSGFIEQLLKHRELTKIYSTYMVGIKDKLTPDSYIHGNFLLHGTVTGRLSSRKPNLQNIPRDTTSSLIKKMYIAQFGYLILQLDYSQAELRVMAQMANEKTMIKWFNEGRDIHLATACRKWDYDYDKAKNILDDTNHEKYKTWKIRRKQAKIINFGIIYEEGPAKLAEGLSDPESGVYVDEQEAREFLANYFKLFPNVKKFINRQHRFVEKYGYVRNLFGRYRRLPDIWGYGNYGFYLRAQRQSTNSPVQGTASDFALFSSILIREEKLKGNLPFDMPQIWTVHDSLGFYIRPNMIHKVVPILEPICENPETKKWFDFEMTKVTMKIDFEIGPTWLDLKPYDSNKDYTKG